SSISFGAGGAFGSLLSGYLWSGMGPEAPYWVAAGYALIAVIIAILWLGHRDAPSGQAVKQVQ
ncbi:MAG: MFS transporter, partial [Candidatus Thiodiazotropha taylori]|nr:MFS transporter [Candidatus Thiodiazotropha taylori]MCW4325148.1 MFS transporter [Candidatus Thiodiazotropha taylori]